jgi:hypothetical protein
MAADTIRFEGYHLPGMQAGVEKLQTTLDLTLPATGFSDRFISPELTVLISGPRFIFSPAELYALFPPRDSFGEWDNVLPHVELTPSTLPWQRKSGASDNTTPWLALILLQEDEWGDPSRVVAEKMAWEDLRDEIRRSQNPVRLSIEATDQPPEKGQHFPPVQALRIEQAWLQQLMPTAEDLRWLTHVRAGHDAQGQEVERAIVACNRLPRQGARAAVHLISLEQRLSSDGSFRYAAAADGKVLLLSLHSWQFTCPADEQFKVSDKAIGRLDQPLQGQVQARFPAGEARDALYRGREAFVAALDGFGKADQDALVNACHVQSETFKGLMDALDCGWLHMPAREQSNPLFELGSVPVAHGLRNGGKTASWYHGPLIADKKLDAGIEAALLQTLPVRNADQLLLYNETTRMLDASYAAAWELGRLLAISEPRVSQQIAQWKSSHAREAGLVEQNLWFSHIPFTDSQFAHRAGGLLEKKLQAIFTDFSRLRGVPFQYLVPHASLLPDESLRFFYVDPLWVECLLDGAFSIGRTTRFDLARERDAQGQLQFPHQQARPAMSGVILRSDLVAGWPSLMVEGYSSPDPAAPSKLELVRYERLGQNVAIALFAGELKTLTLHLPPESLHFGFSRDASDGGQYAKEVKDLADGNELPTQDGRSRKTAVNFGWRRGAEALRIFVPGRMVDNINSRLKAAGQPDRPLETVVHSGHLAIQLLEGVPRLQVALRNS